MFKRDPQTLGLIIQKMNPYIEKRGEAIVNDEANLKDPIAFTQKLLNLKAEMDTMLKESFDNSMLFQKGRDSSFQNFMNTKQNTPHYLALYSHKELTSGLKGVSDEETEERLDAIIRLFCCLHGRDVFMKAYVKHLAQRLLNKTMLSMDAEEVMLQKLKVECGLNQVNKMTQMFKDMQLSKDLQQQFRDHKKTSLVGGVEFGIEVLMTGNWPVDNQPTCTIPPAMKMCTTDFERFYKNKHQNRNLLWLYHNG